MKFCGYFDESLPFAEFAWQHIRHQDAPLSINQERLALSNRLLQAKSRDAGGGTWNEVPIKCPSIPKNSENLDMFW